MTTVQEIAFSFVKFYYQRLHEDPAPLYQIYTDDAKLTHSDVPITAGVNFITKTLETRSLTCKSEIESFYANYKVNKPKIRVSTIDAQTAFENSVLLCVVGELALSDEIAVYRFTQTFILKPTGEGNTYDIVNDIFRLIPDDDYELSHPQSDVSTAASGASEETDGTEVIDGVYASEKASTNIIDAETSKNNTEEGHEANTAEEKTTAPPENAPTADGNDASNSGLTENVAEAPHTNGTEIDDEVKKGKTIEESQNFKERDVSSEKPAAKLDDEKPVAKASKEQKKEPTEEAKPLKAGSWAQAVSSTSNKPLVLKPKTVKQGKTQVQPPTQPQPSATPPSQGNALSDVTNAPKQGKKKLADLANTVVAKNVNALSAEQIIRGFEKEFGRVVRVEPKGHWALVALASSESSKQALAKKSIKIEGSVVEIDQKPAKQGFTDKRKPTNGNTIKVGAKDKQQAASGSQKKKTKQVN